MEELKEFEDLVNLGAVTRTVKVGGYEIELKTLSSFEYSKMTERIRDDFPTHSKRLEAMQREIIAAAIYTINGKRLSLEAKQTILSTSQLGLANMLYTEYSSMVDEQSKMLESAKKDSSRTKTPSIASERAPGLK